MMAVVKRFDGMALLAARDTEADVGTGVAGAGEYSRSGAAAIAQAATGRLSEALRSLEEVSKGLGDVEGARGFEAIRYRTYTLEQRTLPRFLKARPQWRLCVLVTESLCQLPWMRVVEGAIAGGADCIQLREKMIEGGELLDRAVAARELTRRLGCALVINDRPDIAAACGADGVHLGQTDMPVGAVRNLFGGGLLIGVSTGNVSQAKAAVEAGADGCGIGPMFATTTKHKPVLAGPAYAREYLATPLLAAVPHLAIGGITPENVGELWAAGVKGIAVSSVVCTADDPAAVCRRLLARDG